MCRTGPLSRARSALWGPAAGRDPGPVLPPARFLRVPPSPLPQRPHRCCSRGTRGTRLPRSPPAAPLLRPARSDTLRSPASPPHIPRRRHIHRRPPRSSPHTLPPRSPAPVPTRYRPPGPRRTPAPRSTGLIPFAPRRPPGAARRAALRPPHPHRRYLLPRVPLPSHPRGRRSEPGAGAGPCRGPGPGRAGAGAAAASRPSRRAHAPPPPGPARNKGGARRPRRHLGARGARGDSGDSARDSGGCPAAASLQPGSGGALSARQRPGLPLRRCHKFLFRVFISWRFFLCFGVFDVFCLAGPRRKRRFLYRPLYGHS